MQPSALGLERASFSMVRFTTAAAALLAKADTSVLIIAARFARAESPGALKSSRQVPRSRDGREKKLLQDEIHQCSTWQAGN
jgi:hypothetical protein